MLLLIIFYVKSLVVCSESFVAQIHRSYSVVLFFDLIPLFTNVVEFGSFVFIG